MKNIGFILWLLTLPAWGGSNGTAIPQETAARFCQLLINDGESIMPLSAHARRVIEPCDSLTCEQLFVEFLLRDDNWQSLRLFPHRQDDGTIIWYAQEKSCLHQWTLSIRNISARYFPDFCKK